MNKPIAIWFHCLFYLGDPPELLPKAIEIVAEQMAQLKESGLLDACTEMVVGVNGGPESEALAPLILPEKAKVVYHGLASRSENLSIVALQEWSKKHPGWLVLYFHSKSATHPPDSAYGNNVSTPWRRAMMHDLVTNWRQCVSELNVGYDICCSHWLWNQADGSQHLPAGNFAWFTSDFIAQLPSMYARERIKVSGIGALESRYEAEVHWGNSHRRPNVSQIRPNGGGGVP